LIQGGILLLWLAICLRASATVWLPVYWTNWTPCGALPLFLIVTSTRPPFADFGALKLAALPCSEIDKESLLGLVLLLPQAASAATTVAAHAASASSARRHSPPPPAPPGRAASDRERRS